MKKYKVCPICGQQNPPVRLECIECETDLSGSPVVDEETEAMRPVLPVSPVVPETAGELVRRCECGRENPVQARKCSACGEDISDIVPVPGGTEHTSHYTLLSVDGEYAFEPTETSSVIGREGRMKEYLSQKTYVSRKHAEIRLIDDSLQIRNWSETNYTFINNQKISGDQFTELHDGDEIGLGGVVKDGQRQPEAAYFVVRVNPCM